MEWPVINLVNSAMAAEQRRGFGKVDCPEVRLVQVGEAGSFDR
jgi:hypothetical protein